MTDSVEKTPAFPQVQDWPKTSWSGMSLRDYFAAQAMAGDWAGLSGAFVPTTGDDTLLASAHLYYRMADAMLKAKEK